MTQRYLLLVLAGALAAPNLLLAQATAPAAPAAPPSSSERIARIASSQGSSSEATNLVRYDLDFPGGSPDQLVRAIEKASGRPLNAIVPKGGEEAELPPLRMKGVTTPMLFQALQNASRKTLYYPRPVYIRSLGGSTSQFNSWSVSYGFITQGPQSDDSVWYFTYDGGPPPVVPDETLRVCRFYQLAPYLETCKVEDITTAIETGYKMLGEESPPTISFHKDTKLLIAVGEEDKLRLIYDVLNELPRNPDSARKLPSPPRIPTPAAPPTKAE